MCGSRGAGVVASSCVIVRRETVLERSLDWGAIQPFTGLLGLGCHSILV